MAIAAEVFADLLPGGAEVVAAGARHAERLRLHERCDRRCGLPRCRGTHVDPWPSAPEERAPQTHEPVDDVDDEEEEEERG
ncbi:hypothetical protein BH23CHL8_BH23CHL8_27310 [soil metagenome]